MSDSKLFYQALDAFLAEKGFHACLRRVKNDGHMIRFYIAVARNSACGKTGCCAEVSVRQLLHHMDKVPGWNQEYRLRVLEASGFPSDFV